MNAAQMLQSVVAVVAKFRPSVEKRKTIEIRESLKYVCTQNQNWKRSTSRSRSRCRNRSRSRSRGCFCIILLPVQTAGLRRWVVCNFNELEMICAGRRCCCCSNQAQQDTQDIGPQEDKIYMTINIDIRDHVVNSTLHACPDILDAPPPAAAAAAALT